MLVVLLTARRDSWLADQQVKYLNLVFESETMVIASTSNEGCLTEQVLAFRELDRIGFAVERQREEIGIRYET